MDDKLVRLVLMVSVTLMSAASHSECDSEICVKSKVRNCRTRKIECQRNSKRSRK